ncbi:hypothetical protein ACFPTY_20080 [Halomonas beimenensis]|uniref:hypothetical protein n=1 Tax=Halomonas beimenensis TaxID=475662 RepID=UPI0036227A5B
MLIPLAAFPVSSGLRLATANRFLNPTTGQAGHQPAGLISRRPPGAIRPNC